MLYKESLTNKWFSGLSRAQGILVMKDRMPERMHRKLRGDYPIPTKWWNTLNHVQKSDVYLRFKHLKKQTIKRSKSKIKSRGEENDD